MAGELISLACKVPIGNPAEKASRAALSKSFPVAGTYLAETDRLNLPSISVLSITITLSLC